jgi:hypothetical protein
LATNDHLNNYAKSPQPTLSFSGEFFFVSGLKGLLSLWSGGWLCGFLSMTSLIETLLLCKEQETKALQNNNVKINHVTICSEDPH